ncbi:MAG: alpha/beta hydrolase [Gammaproteobacteria bacterium]|nr:MAG: alpha/beta hydrolase [Gammaproteobacteria bacterium]
MTASRPRFQSLELDIAGQHIAGIRREALGSAEARILCLHGWLDNANSFLPLMPELPACDLVAIDLPGHGYSTHLHDSYSFPQMMLLARRVIAELQWEECVIMGHSLGGSVAALLAAAAPETVSALISIDSCGPLSEAASEWPARMRRALAERLEENRFASRRFATPDEAVASRLRATTMELRSAQLIIDRQLDLHDGEFHWRFDPTLRYSSWLYQSEEQVRAALAAIECPSLFIIADEGFPAQREETDGRLACVSNLRRIDLTGHHHLHMDTPEPVAAAINAFLGTTPALGG